MTNQYALNEISDENHITLSWIQRHFNLNYYNAMRLIDNLIDDGVLIPFVKTAKYTVDQVRIKELLS